MSVRYLVQVKDDVSGEWVDGPRFMSFWLALCETSAFAEARVVRRDGREWSADALEVR